jgi:hypothetical protein
VPLGNRKRFLEAERRSSSSAMRGPPQARDGPVDTRWSWSGSATAKPTSLLSTAAFECVETFGRSNSRVPDAAAEPVVVAAHARPPSSAPYEYDYHAVLSSVYKDKRSSSDRSAQDDREDAVTRNVIDWYSATHGGALPRLSDTVYGFL